MHKFDLLAKFISRFFSVFSHRMGRRHRRYRIRGQLGMTVLRADDLSWPALVSDLVRWSDVVFVDIPTGSQNLRKEVEILASAQDFVKVVWLCPNPAAAIEITPNGYAVLGVEFRGYPTVMVYPQSDQIDSEASFVYSRLASSQYHIAARYLTAFLDGQLLPSVDSSGSIRKRFFQSPIQLMKDQDTQNYSQ